jgi:cation diffusion facilitator CzcD-associated flavoprotein CzcO
MSKTIYDWAVVGGGPAGMAAVGKLLDSGVDPKQLLWLDPQFEVGDFGGKWKNIPSNTRVGLFLQFLHSIKSFEFMDVTHQFELAKLDPQATCRLEYMAEPLRWVTQHLRSRVSSEEALVSNCYLHNQVWHLESSADTFQAKQVILATGVEQKSLEYDVKELSLDIALNPELLKDQVSEMKRVAVFGSSHSAILAMRFLKEAGVESIVNFYKSPLRYAVYFDDWIMYDDTGLKGTTAQWSHENIDTDAVSGIERYYSSDENIASYLSSCDHVVYAVGFERRHSLAVCGEKMMSYDRRSGIIAPGMFGFGIGFPEAFTTPLGNMAHRVGLWKFLNYLNRVLPIWLRYHA